jgi:iron complex transport system permease protein
MNRDIIKWMIYAFPVPILVFSLCVGPSDIVSPRQVMTWFLSIFSENSREAMGGDTLVAVILKDVRLPRILLTFMVGSALSISGSAMQALFRNPLVSPYVLGVSSGSALGAALAIIFPMLPIQLSAFTFGVMAAGISYFIARIHNTVSVTSLVLSGVIISSVFTSFLALIQFLIDPNRLQAIVHWTMGNLHTASWSKIYSGGPLIVVAAVCLLMLGWRMNVLAMGDEEAKAVGINPEKEKLFILLPAVLATSASVAVAGIIGFMGLVVPHLVRMMLGPDNRRTIPACFCFGGVFLVMMDNIARSFALVEIPVGIFTNFLGAPLFVYLLRKSRTGWDI